MTITKIGSGSHSLETPTTYLTPIKKLSSCSSAELLQCLVYLRLAYNPPVRGSRRRRSSISQSHGSSTFSSDPFERSYTIRWLTALISRRSDSDTLIQEAASLLALCSGTAGAGTLQRDFIFPGSPAVHVKLTDVPLDGDIDGVGAQTWGGACVLAEALVADPPAFGLHPDSESTTRVLELGAGTGLVSLAAANLYQHWNTPVTIVATDFYPTVLVNLESNIAANFPSPVNVCPLDWSAFPDDENPHALLQEPFDVILGADVVYEPQHAVWIKPCIQKLLRKSPLAAFHLMVPLRATHTMETGSIESVFCHTPGDIGIISKEIFVCEVDERDTMEYAYYKVGWV